MKFSVFTVGMPEYTPEQGVALLKECGYDGVEFRVCPLPTDPAVLAQAPSYWGNNLCTVNEETLAQDGPKLRALCDAAGVEVCALATYVNCAETERAERVMKAAAEMGVSKIRVTPYRYDGSRHYRVLFDQAVADYRALEGLAKKYGVKVNLEMHMNTIIASASAAYRLLSHFDPRHIGVIYDTGNIVYEGLENYQAALEILGEYLDHVHIKNAQWLVKETVDSTKKWQADWAAMNEGCTDFEKVFQALRAVGYDGWCSFEDFSAGDTAEKLRRNLPYIKQFVK